MAQRTPPGRSQAASLVLALVLAVGTAVSGCSRQDDEYLDAKVKLQLTADATVRELAIALGTYPAGAMALTRTVGSGSGAVHTPEVSAEFLPTSEPYDPEVVAASLRRLEYLEITIAEAGTVSGKAGAGGPTLVVTPGTDSASGLVEARFSGPRFNQSRLTYDETDLPARELEVPFEVSPLEVAELKAAMRASAAIDVPGLAKAGLLPEIARSGQLEVERATSRDQFTLALTVDAPNCYAAYLEKYLPARGYLRPKDSELTWLTTYVRTDSPIVVECVGSDEHRQLVYRTAQPFRLVDSSAEPIEPEAELVRLW